MHPDFESNLITHIFRKFGVSRTTRSDVIFAFVRGTEGARMAVRYASIFAKKYGTLVRYAVFKMVQVRYASKIELKYGTLVRYDSRCEVRSTQILNVPYRTAILAKEFHEVFSTMHAYQCGILFIVLRIYYQC